MKWIIPSNSKAYDLYGAFNKNIFVDWHQKNNFNVGDIAYIYTTSPESRIRFKVRIIKTMIPYSETIDDEEFSKYKEFLENKKTQFYVRFELLEYYENVYELSLNKLLINGLNMAPRSPIHINDKLEKYIEKITLTLDNTRKQSIEINEQFYLRILNECESTSLDKNTTSNYRVEQQFLRRYLFDCKETFKCGICGKEYPVDMLTTSHIKKRCDCSKDEKLDYKNIVMPMCDFGCDRAYENGYIYVDNLGKIRINYSKNPTEDMLNIFKNFEGRTCSYFNKKTSKYFDAHRKKFGL